MKRSLFALFVFLSFSLHALAAVNINTATQAELESLHGIGPAKAQAIIDYRKKHGPFKSVSELQKVKGIGTVTLERVRKDVSVSGTAAAVMPQKNALAKQTKASGSAKATQADKPINTYKPAKADKPAIAPESSATARNAYNGAKKVKADISISDRK